MPTLIHTALLTYQKNQRSLGLSEDTISRVMLNTSMFTRDMHLTRLGEITTENIIDWGEAKLTSGRIGHSTLYTYYNSIRAFLHFVRTIGYRHDVNCSRIKCQPRYKSRVWLKPVEIRRIIAHATPKTAILIRLMYTTGLRLSEAISLTDAHLGDTTIFITGKGFKVRPVFVTKEILTDLTTLAAIHGGYCFVDNYNKPLSRSKAYYHIKKAMEKAGFAYAYPHSLRHSFCTELLRKGVSLAHTSRLMGHASVSITQIYEHLVTDDIQKAHGMLTRV